MSRLSLFITILLATIISCKEDSTDLNFDSEVFENSLVNFQIDIAASEFNKLTKDLTPKSDGHQSNFVVLIKRLEEQSRSLTVLNVCHGCIFTYPPISEIQVEIDSLGFQVTRNINILTPENDLLSLKGFH